jgi:F-type H+-transporting ATPase subunit delta
VSAQARPQDYAAAIYDLALEPWLKQLGGIQKVVKGDAALRDDLHSPGLSTRDKLDQLSQAMPVEVSGEVRKFLGTLLEAGQIDQLDAILLELDRLAQRRPERTVAHVTSAVPLTESEQEAMRAKLADQFGSDLEMRFEVDASLLGGVRLRVGDRIIDGSVAGKLAALRDHLTAQ